MALECHLNEPVTPGLGTESHSAGWSGGTGAVDRYSRIGLTNPPTSEQYEGFALPASGNWTSARSGLFIDKNYFFRVAVADDSGIAESGVDSFKTNALAAVMPAPGSSAITSHEATITTNTFTPNVTDSTWVVSLYYKKTTDVSYVLAGSSAVDNPFSFDLTGLDAFTEYSFYAEIVRTTNNNTTLASSVQTFTTAEGVPEVVTNVATSVTATSAILQGTLDINEGTGVNVYFKWDTVTPPVANQTANQSKSADGDFSQAISGLGLNKYYFQAFASFATPSGSPVSGGIQSFVFAKPGSLWVEGTKLHVISTSFQIYAAEGTLIGAAAGQIGSVWVEGDNLNYIDSSGNERSIAGSDEGVQTGKAGSIWQEANYLGWLDFSQHKRLGTGVLQ